MDAKKKARLRRDIKSLVESSIAPLVNECITQRLTQYAEVLHDEHFTTPAAAQASATGRGEAVGPRLPSTLPYVDRLWNTRTQTVARDSVSLVLHDYARAALLLNAATHTPASEDSAGKDAERLDWLSTVLIDGTPWGGTTGGSWYIDGESYWDCTLREAIDTAREAAEKRGSEHE